MTASILSHFPVPVLTNKQGHLPYRRSWFLQDIRSGVGILRMLALLGRMNRRRLATLPDRNLRTVFLALLDELRERFPIEDIVYWQVEEEWGDEDIGYAAQKIPVEVQGVNLFEEQLPAPLAVCYVLQRPADADEVLRHQESLDGHKRWLTPMVRALANDEIEEQDARDTLHLPRGRAWLGPWDALPRMCQYSVSNTGHGFLDYDHYGMSENGWDMYPDLNLEEIRGLESAWKTCKPILERIHKLVDYIESGGTERLQLLANVVNGDAAALREITVPKPRVSTLGQVFRGN